MNISKCWIVGDVKWEKGIAHITITESKTQARQLAEARLAYAHWEWNKNQERMQQYIERNNARFKTIDDMIKAYAAGKWNGSDGYVLKQALLIRSGVWIRSATNGESVHITEPSQKAIQKRAKLEKDSAAWADKMMRGLLTSLKRK